MFIKMSMKRGLILMINVIASLGLYPGAEAIAFDEGK